MPIDEGAEFRPVRIAILTVSDTRTASTDKSGALLADLVANAGHELASRAIVRDDRDEIVARLNELIDDPEIDVVITTGGTGVTGRDVTPEALECVQDKAIPGFGELFRWLSFQSIGAATIQSRACACVSRGTYIFALPGSSGAVRDGWEGILAGQLDSRNKPCNFVDLMPRLKEHQTRLR